ncbi:MAG: ribosome maturation factor RimM [Myxococcota bacterium]|nr:ribosome maturation factor RimM [Myxococcota bacterium]
MWVEVGYVLRAHGVAGELRVVLHSPEEGLPDSLERVRLVKGAKSRKYSLQSVRPTKDAILVRLVGVGGREEAALLKGHTVEVEEAQLPEVEGREHYLYQVIGATVVDANGSPIGVLEGFLETSAHPIAVLRYDGVERLVPWVEAFFVGFDRASFTVTMNVPEGLWDEPERAEEAP